LLFPENKALNALIACEPEVVLASPDNSTPDSQLKTLSNLSDLYERELVGIIGWAKQIPGIYKNNS
jgi:estrogen-related receptor ERR